MREALPGDLPGVLAGYEWLFAAPGSVPDGWDPGRALDRLERTLADEASTVIVAERGGAVVGFCTVYMEFESVRFGRRGWVEDLAVDPAERSGGIGASLLDAARAWARERGAEWLKLESGQARTDAHRFYERERPQNLSRSFGWRLP